jgi:hypothetical protein
MLFKKRKLRNGAVLTQEKMIEMFGNKINWLYTNGEVSFRATKYKHRLPTYYKSCYGDTRKVKTGDYICMASQENTMQEQAIWAMSEREVSKFSSEGLWQKPKKRGWQATGKYNDCGLEKRPGWHHEK